MLFFDELAAVTIENCRTYLSQVSSGTAWDRENGKNACKAKTTMHLQEKSCKTIGIFGEQSKYCEGFELILSEPASRLTFRGGSLCSEEFTKS